MLVYRVARELQQKQSMLSQRYGRLKTPLSEHRSLGLFGSLEKKGADYLLCGDVQGRRGRHFL